MLKKAYILWLLGILSPLAQAVPTVQFDSATYSVNEDAGYVTITVTISDAPDETVTVDYSASDDSAIEGEDYTVEGSGTLRWDLFDGSDKTFTVTIYNDFEEEDNETFKLKLTNVTGAKLGKPEKAEVTIVDNDGPPPPGTLQFSSSKYNVGEGEGLTEITVSRVNGSNNVVTVQCVSSDGTAEAVKDYTAVSKKLKWSHGETGDKFCTVGINDDEELEGNEVFSLHLKNATGGADIGDPSSAQVTIVDNEVPKNHGIFKFSDSYYSVGEDSGVVKLKVSRVYGSDGVVSVDYASSDGTATAGEDYVGDTNTLNWEDGDDSDKTITIPIFDDVISEYKETFIMKLSNPTGGAVLGLPNPVVVTIIDDDVPVKPGTLQFSESKYSVYEDGKIVVAPVTRVKGSDGAVSVQCISYNDTATAEEDYTSVSGQLNWGNGDANDKNCIVSILDDTIYEGNETFKLKLKNPTGGAKIRKPKKAVVTIIDNDPQPGTLQFKNATYSVNEDGGSVEITVTRVNGSEGKASVKVVSSNGTAKKGKDFDKINKTLKWDDGEAGDNTFTVDIINDSQAEDDEIFYLKLKNAKGAELGNPKKAEVTIIDDDRKTGTLQFSSDKYNVNEGDGLVAIAVTRIDGSDGAASVQVATNDGTAENGEDYEKTTKTLKWDDGDDSAQTFTVDISDDLVAEGNETFYLKLENAEGAELGNPIEAEVTIIDDDQETGTLQFSSDNYNVDEGDGSVAITVTRVDGSDGAVSVDAITSDGTADSDEDYEKTTESLNWGDGDNSDKTFTVDIFDDVEVELDETFALTLENATGGVAIGDPAAVTIIDDDGLCDDVAEISTEECKVLVALYKSTDGANWTDNEGWNVTNTPCDWEGVTCDSGHVSRLYLYSNNLNGEIPPELGNLGKLKRLLLYNNILSGAIPFELGNLTKLEYLRLEDNNLCGEIPDELMNTNIPPQTGYLKLDRNHLITDVSDELKDWLDVRNPGWDDSQTECPVESNTVQFVQSYYEVDEDGGSVTLKVERIEGDGAISVDYATADGTATEDEDYDGQTGTLSWGENDFDDKEIEIAIIYDDGHEENETFAVKLSNPSDGAVLGTPKRAIVTIKDIVGGICEEVTEISKDECNALIALYDDTNGRNWADNTGWTRTNTPCQWKGVECDGGYVSYLYLNSNNLDGEIPSELNNLKWLKRLLLSKNQLSGVIPPEIGDLENLEYFWLQENSLCGNIPELLRETSVPPKEGYLKLDNNHLEVDVSEVLEAWLEVRNPTWDENQTVCPAPSVLQFSKSMYSVNENKRSVFITVTRTGSSEGEVSVVCATSDDSAIAGYDYNEIFEVLSWADGDSSDKVCQIDILDDSDPESNETFIVGLGYPDGAELGTPNTAVVMFVDDE
jgi:uncharacterized membrane-anchored protein/ribosomal protein L35AE/L33A